MSRERERGRERERKGIEREMYCITKDRQPDRNEMERKT